MAIMIREPKTFGERLNRLLRESDLTNAQVGEAIGVSGQAVSRWRNDGSIEYDNLKGLAKYLGVSWVWLRYGDEALIDVRSLSSRESDPGESRERRNQIKELRENEKRLRLATDAADIGTWDLDIMTQELSWSDTTFRLFKTTPEQFSGDKSAFEYFVHPTDGARVRQAWESHVSGESDLYSVDHRVILDNGEIRWMREAGKVFMGENGQPEKMRGIVSDITDHYVRETEAVKGRLRREALKAQEHVGVIEFTSDLIIALWNKGAERIFGYSEEEAMGKSAYDLIIPDDERTQTWVSEVASELKNHTDSRTSINNNVTKSGEIIECNWHNTPMHNSGGYMECIFSVVRVTSS